MLYPRVLTCIFRTYRHHRTPLCIWFLGNMTCPHLTDVKGNRGGPGLRRPTLRCRCPRARRGALAGERRSKALPTDTSGRGGGMEGANIKCVQAVDFLSPGFITDEIYC